MSDTIRVHVVDYGKKNLMMRYRCPMTGKQVARSTGTTSKKEAAKVAAKWEAELQEGRWQPSARMKWDAFREHFLDEVAHDRRSATVAQYTATFNAFERHCRPTTLADLTTERVSGFVRELRKKRTVMRGGVETQEALSPATVARHLRHLKAIARWANRQGLLPRVPTFDMPKAAAGAQRMKGRPITEEEFERMLAACEKVVGAQAAPSWQLMLRGLWTTGLRLGEAIALRWDDRPGGVRVRLAGRKSVLEFDGAAQKSGKTQAVPLAPEAVRLLEPLEAARGYVFRPLRMDGKAEPMARDLLKWSKIISRIGSAAKVVTDAEKGSTASAHDLRRSFGYRWSRRVMPAQLMALMRHASMSTTVAFYVGRNAETTAAELWDAVGNLDAGGNLLGNLEHSGAAADSKNP